MKTIRHTALLIAFHCLLAVSWNVRAEPNVVESQVKAAYLYKFMAYVEWPSSVFAQADTPITIGIIGADEIADELNLLKRGHLVNNRTLEVKLLKSGETLPGLQILFIGGNQESGRVKRLLDSIQTQPVLTVSDSPGGLANGSIINFVPVDERIRFEVSVAQAERSGLKISARLLNVAHKIETRKP